MFVIFDNELFIILLHKYFIYCVTALSSFWISCYYYYHSPLILNFFWIFCRYNGFLPQGDRGRRRSKFVLYKRNESNGVKRSNHYIVQSPENTKAILDAQQHSISYTLSRNQAVIVEYKEDAETDMFQVSYTFLRILFCGFYFSYNFTFCIYFSIL